MEEFCIKNINAEQAKIKKYFFLKNIKNSSKVM